MTRAADDFDAIREGLRIMRRQEQLMQASSVNPVCLVNHSYCIACDAFFDPKTHVCEIPLPVADRFQWTASDDDEEASDETA